MERRRAENVHGPPTAGAFSVRSPSDVADRRLRTRIPGPAASPAPAALAALLGALLLTPGGALNAQETGAISGTVTDANRDAPLGLARVSIPRLDRHTTADERGRFRFGDLPAGTHDVRVRYLGFETTVREVNVVAGEVATVEILVSPRPLSVEDLEVTSLSLTWFPGFLRRRQERTGHFFTRREIAAAHPEHLTDLLRGREGIRLGFNRLAFGANRRFPQLHYTGPAYERGGFGRPRRQSPFCRPVVLVDGEPMGPGSRYHHFNEIPPERVLAMEVYYRAEEMPEKITFNDLRLVSLSAEAVRTAAEMGGGARAGRSGRPAEGDGGLRQTLAGTGLENGFRRSLLDRREDRRQRMQRTVFAGLYESMPRMEHCGVILVWTEFYPLGG